MIIYLLLLISLAFFFYFTLGNDLPVSLEELRSKIILYGSQLAFAAIFFLIGKTLFMTVLSGFILGFLGWYVPKWIEESIAFRKKAKIREMTKNFVNTAAGMYAANMVTPQIIRIMAEKMPEPLSSDFEEMIAKRNMSPNLKEASFPVMFAKLADKYGVEELRAIAPIIEAAERAGGPRSASKGLKRLGQAIRQQERLATERIKATSQPKIAAIVVISLLVFGLFLDATVLRGFYETGAGPLILTAATFVVVGLFFLYRKIMVD